MNQRKAIGLSADEDRLLKELYIRWNIPIDQFEKRPHDLRALVDAFNAQSGRTDTTEDVMHFMKTRRKRGLWVKLGAGHKTSPSLSGMLSAEEGEILIDIYNKDVAAMGLGSDVLSYTPEVSKLIAKEFALRTRHRVPAHVLIAKLTEMRKRGLLPKVEPKSKDDGLGFSDIDDVAG